MAAIQVGLLISATVPPGAPDREHRTNPEPGYPADDPIGRRAGHRRPPRPPIRSQSAPEDP
jgi:hypothetical protein